MTFASFLLSEGIGEHCAQSRSANGSLAHLQIMTQQSTHMCGYVKYMNAIKLLDILMMGLAQILQ